MSRNRILANANAATIVGVMLFSAALLISARESNVRYRKIILKVRMYPSHKRQTGAGMAYRLRLMPSRQERNFWWHWSKI